MSKQIAIKKRRHESFGDQMISVVCYIVFSICAILCLYPFYYMFINTISASNVSTSDWLVGGSFTGMSSGQAAKKNCAVSEE